MGVFFSLSDTFFYPPFYPEHCISYDRTANLRDVREVRLMV